MSSVERSACILVYAVVAIADAILVVEYSREDKIPQEAEHEVVEKKPAPEWPAHGTVEFKEVVMQYRPGLPFVLKGLSLKVDGGEKIGVVGRCANGWCELGTGRLIGVCRTGAGKSSLMLALFRIIELTSGSITIDGSAFTPQYEMVFVC